MSSEKEFKVNEYITLKLEETNTVLYINEERFDQCFRLLLNIPIDDFENIESIDKVIDILEKPPIGGIKVDFKENNEFWAHCSNIQAWVDNKYDTRILHRNLAFPLLKRLTEIGDPVARRVFKEEIAKRLLSGHGAVILYLFNEGYLEYFEEEELDSLIAEIPVSGLFDYFPIISSYEGKFKPLINNRDSEVVNEYISLKALQESIKKEGRKFLFKPVGSHHPEDFLFLEEEDYIEEYHDIPKMEYSHNKNRIIGISLYNRLWRDYGRFPDSLGNFSKLEILDLSSCFLKASAFPQSLTNLKSLKGLYIQYNELESIPPPFFQLKSLKKLVARKNKIRFLDNAIGNLVLLEDLILDNNRLEQLPESIGNLTNLKRLDLEYNLIKQVPESIGNLHNLVELNLRCALTMEIPEGELHRLPKSFNQLKNLKILDIEGNCWEESVLKQIVELTMLEELTMDSLDIPPSFKNLSRLKKLYIHFKGLNRYKFSDTITLLPSLEKLHIEHLSARELPESLGNLKKLNYLGLSQGSFNTLPESLGNLVLLEELYLSQTHHLNSLPESFGNLIKLKKLNLSINRLSKLPESFGKLRNLRELHLDRCRLTSLPDSFGNLVSLEKLWLDNNHLETLPESFGNLKLLELLYLDENPLITLPESFGSLTSLKTLYIMGISDYELKQRYGKYESITQKKTNLTSLPKSFGNLKSLNMVKIENCCLENLPDTIGNLQSLETLDLSRNNLTTLPDSIGNLQSLRFLNISNNNLERLPRSISKLNKLNYLNVGGDIILKSIANRLLKNRIGKKEVHIK